MHDLLLTSVLDRFGDLASLALAVLAFLLLFAVLELLDRA